MRSEFIFFIKTVFITSIICWIGPAIGWFKNHDIISDVPWWKMYGGAFYFFLMEEVDAKLNTLSYWGFWSIVFVLVVFALRRRFRFSSAIIVFAVVSWFFLGIGTLMMQNA